MNIISAAVLSDRGVLQITGPEAEEFLQGLVSNDVKLVETGAGIHTALLSPQGKILFDFFITGTDAGYLVDCAASQMGDLLKRLNMYKLRSKVEIEDLSASHSIAACWSGACDIKGETSYDDPRHTGLGRRVIGGLDELKKQIAAQADYQALRIGLGIAEGGQDFAPGEVFPHEANFDLLNGVSFTKGCFVGQEVVSRMRHKTEIRKRFLPVCLDGPVTGVGTPVLSNGKKAGIMGSCVKSRGIALLRFDRIDRGAKITCGETQLQVMQPDWADFSVPAG